MNILKSKRGDRKDRKELVWHAFRFMFKAQQAPKHPIFSLLFILLIKFLIH